MNNKQAIYYQIVSNRSKKASYLVRKFQHLAPNNWIEDENLAKYLFVFGGDGTFLRNRSLYRNKKVIPINAGNLGYYAYFQASNLEDIFESVTKQNNYIKPLVIKTRIDHIDYYALNEMYLQAPAVMDVTIYINQSLLQNFKGSALLISTPLGSTAHNKNAGGAILEPKAHVYQMVEICPMTQKKYHSLKAPLILDMHKKLSLVNQKPYERVKIIMDGQSIFPKFHKTLDISCNFAPFLIYDPNSEAHYYNKLRASFIND